MISTAYPQINPTIAKKISLFLGREMPQEIHRIRTNRTFNNLIDFLKRIEHFNPSDGS